MTYLVARPSVVCCSRHDICGRYAYSHAVCCSVLQCVTVCCSVLHVLQVVTYVVGMPMHMHLEGHQTRIEVPMMDSRDSSGPSCTVHTYIDSTE